MIVTNIFEAMQAGKELANASTWKNRQLLVSKLIVLLGAAIPLAKFAGYEIPLTSEEVAVLAGGIGIVAGLFNSVATVVSTSKVGLPSRGDDVPPARIDGSGNGNSKSGIRSDAGDDYPLPYLNDMDGKG